MRLLLLCFLLAGCSMTHFYQGQAVTQELKKNAIGLRLVQSTIDSDFQQKETFLKEIVKTGKDPFIREGLDQKLLEMKTKREAVLQKMSHIQNLNDGLIEQVENKNKISENDPVFGEIENFATVKNLELSILMNEFANYKKASIEFEKLAFFTRMVKR